MAALGHIPVLAPGEPSAMAALVPAVPTGSSNLTEPAALPATHTEQQELNTYGRLTSRATAERRISAVMQVLSSGRNKQVCGNSMEPSIAAQAAHLWHWRHVVRA